MGSPTTAPAGSDRASERYYRPELDVLRFFAFLSVFLFHGLPSVVVAKHAGWSHWAASIAADFKSAGRFGVCLFFVLSSFLITELLMRERRNTGTVHVKAFYVRRVLRIWPLYFFFLFFGTLLGHFVPGWEVEVPRLLAFLFLLGNWYNVAFSATSNPIAPLWSISIEEQFYLTWPVLVFLLKRQTLSLVSVCLVVVSTSVRLTSYFHGAPPTFPHMFTLARLDSIAFGCLAALWLRSPTCTLARWRVRSYQFLGFGLGSTVLARILMHRNSSIVSYTFLAMAFTGFL